MPFIGNQPADKFLTLEKQVFTTSATDTYTLDREVSSVNDIELFLNNVRQEPTEAYTISGTTLTLASAITASDSMYCIYQGRSVGTQAPATGSVTNAMLAGSISPSKISNLYPYRNLIINGDMSIAQRGTSASGITSSGYQTVDRLTLDLSSAGTWTVSQDTDVPTGQGFSKSFKLACTTANASLSASNRIAFRQFFEGQMFQLLKKGTSNAESVTLSFWVKSNKTGTYVIELYDHDNSRHINKSYTINSANTWEKKTLTFAGDTTGSLDNDNALSFHLEFWLGAGSTYTSGSLQTSWGSNTTANRAVGVVNLADSTSNYINITGVQLEVGTSASDFEFLPYDVNLERCERYFERLHREATTTERVSIGWFNTTTNLQAEIHYKEKRTQPSITINNVGNFRVNYLNSATTPSGASGNTIGKKKSTIAWTVSGMTAGQGGGVRTDTTSATIDVDAEL